MKAHVKEKRTESRLTNAVKEAMERNEEKGNGGRVIRGRETKRKGGGGGRGREEEGSEGGRTRARSERGAREKKGEMSEEKKEEVEKGQSGSMYVGRGGKGVKIPVVHFSVPAAGNVSGVDRVVEELRLPISHRVLCIACIYACIGQIPFCPNIPWPAACRSDRFNQRQSIHGVFSLPLDGLLLEEGAGFLGCCEPLRLGDLSSICSALHSSRPQEDLTVSTLVFLLGGGRWNPAMQRQRDIQQTGLVGLAQPDSKRSVGTVDRPVVRQHPPLVDRKPGPGCRGCKVGLDAVRLWRAALRAHQRRGLIKIIHSHRRGLIKIIPRFPPAARGSNKVQK